MKQNLAAGFVAVAIILGVGTGFAVHALRSTTTSGTSSDAPVPITTPSPSRSASPNPSNSPSNSPEPTSPTPTDAARPRASSSPSPTRPSLQPTASLRILPGSVGPVSVGMSKTDAVGTGYLAADVALKNCDYTAPLGWRSPYDRSFDVLTDRSGTITSIGISAAGPTTRSGLQVGSTYAEVRRVLDGNGISRANDYGQAGLLINQGSAWIGFSFDAGADSVVDSSRVDFIEVSRGRQPGLLRDGC